MILSILVIVSTISICIGVVKLGLFYLDSYRKLLRSNCFRGPKVLPLVGNGHLFMGTTTDTYQNLREISSKYQSPFRLWLGPQICFVVHDAEHIKRILIDANALDKSVHYDMLKPLFRQGLVTAEVSRWKPHRKAIEPLFGKRVLETFVEKIRKHALLAVEKMETENVRREFDVNHYTMRYMLDGIMDAMMGIEFNSFARKDCALFKAITSTLDTIIARIFKPWLQPDLIFNFTSLGQTFRKNTEYIRGYLKTEVSNAKSEIAKQLESRPKACLLGLLLTSDQSDHKFTDEEIFDEMLTILGAGFETPASLLNVALFILARYPNIQDKVYAEVRDIYGESNSGRLNTTLHVIDQMDYLNRFIKETLRLFPTVPIIFRCLSEEVNIGECTLPAASSVMIDFTQSHRNEKYWPEPLEFNPDRFLPNHPLGPRHPHAYMPFSAGMRNCIGRKFALLTVKMFLVILTSRYIIKTKSAQEATDLELKMCINLKTKDPVMISIERRFLQMS